MNDYLMFLSIAAVFLGLVAVIAILASGYVKAPTDKAFIISGLKKEPKVLIGRAGILISFLERKDEMILRQVSIDIKNKWIYPNNGFYWSRYWCRC